MAYKRAPWLRTEDFSQATFDGSDGRERGNGETHLVEARPFPETFGENAEAKNLTHAIVGVGAFSWGHRLYEEAKAREPRIESSLGSSLLQGGVSEPGEGIPEPEPMFDCIGADLVQLANLCEKCKSKLCAPVGDICNNLFFVPPPGGATENPDVNTDSLKELGADIKKCLAPLKKRLITIGENDLCAIETIILIAGGPKKVASTRLLLADSPYHIRFLCTDEINAQALLR